MSNIHVSGTKSDLKLNVGGGGGYTLQMGYIFGICVEKNAELEPSLRKFNGRVVFQGNQVYDQNHKYAIFQVLGSSPATLQAAKAVDFFGCLPNHVIEVVDAEQAYIQAEKQG